MMLHYLYGVVDRLPDGWCAPRAGLAGAPVAARRLGGLVVVVSRLDVVPPATPRTRAVHHEVVATLLDAGATLPLPYGTAVPAARFREWVTDHRAALKAALAAVRGCVEMSVKLMGLDRDGRDLQVVADSLAERAALPDWRYRISGSESNVAASLAFLVPRGEVAGFLARIAPVASHAVGVAVVPTGPRPPYSFVPELDRAR